ncbi:MAG: UDP-N-acetylmuramoyl-L-alanine--D-glutamate ligase, partial [Candidatus Latescibacterota bacterium]|nr:UDP-N-acetylmuramoyl-L-alanine--D-glutamate ligase [Candidatus Latescibacterota bacterium]
AQYDVLGDALARRATALVLLGDEGPRIAESAHRAGFQGAVAQAIGMEIAVAVARRLTPEGGVVLLAPACASFGMFRDYAQRGEAFRQAVKQLPR